MATRTTHLNELEQELELARLRSHEKHMMYIYGLRWGGLALSALTICIGAVMIFFGLQGSFNWAVEAPHSIGAKLTNASPGIVFATVGMLIGILVVVQQPVSYSTGGTTKRIPGRFRFGRVHLGGD
jgi:hypothetical protein